MMEMFIAVMFTVLLIMLTSSLLNKPSYEQRERKFKQTTLDDYE